MDLLERARCKSPYLAGSSAERVIDELANEIEHLRGLRRVDASVIRHWEEANTKSAIEIERLQTHSKSMIDALNADIDAKAAEIERLEAALQDIVFSHTSEHEWDIARAAPGAPIRTPGIGLLLEQIRHLRTEIERLRAGCERLGPWMSAALDDPQVCAEMKTDIEAWFAALEPKP